MGKNIIVTSGPTNERIDSVMKITNMSTGTLGAIITEHLLDGTTAPDDSSPTYSSRIDNVYYVAQKLAKRPSVPDGQAYKLHDIVVESTQDLLDTLAKLLTEHKIDAVVHSAAVGDYKAKYSVRAEDLIQEILEKQSEQTLTYDNLMQIFENPKAVSDDSGKMSSYEPHLMTMLTLTPKVISSIKKASPDTMLIGFKLLDGVSDDHLFEVAHKLLQKNDADYIIANDLSRIGNGRHFAMVVGENGIRTTCETKAGIADTIRTLIMEN